MGTSGFVLGMSPHRCRNDQPKCNIRDHKAEHSLGAPCNPTGQEPIQGGEGRNEEVTVELASIDQPRSSSRSIFISEGHRRMSVTVRRLVGGSRGQPSSSMKTLAASVTECDIE